MDLKQTDTILYLLNFFRQKADGFNLLFIVQTDIHIFLYDRQSELDRFQLLAIGLTLRINLNFRNQFLN